MRKLQITIAAVVLVGCAAKQKEFDASNKIKGRDVKISYTNKTAKASDISMRKASEADEVFTSEPKASEEFVEASSLASTRTDEALAA